VVHAAPRRSLLRRLFSFKGLLSVLLAFVLLGAAAFGAAWALIDIPNPNQLAQAQTSIIYYADGKTELGRMSTVNRESVPLERIPLHARRAMLAAEDRSFYDNPGISPTGIGRAILAAVTGGDRQGGSTITQQYVKNYFLTQDQTLSRKAREFVISLKIEQQLSKDEILANYLNTIYYGRGAYGIQAASKAYFGKDVKELTVGESALLASVIRAPSAYDPALGRKQAQNAKERVRYVLSGMVEQGWLTEAQRRRVSFPDVRKEAPRKERRSGTAGYLVAMVRNELVSRVGLSEDDVDRGGLRIVTTISKWRQEAAVDAVQRKRPSGGSADGIRVGLASVKPGDGAIVALYGGGDYAKNPYNSATQAQLQGGSTFKVFTTVAALQQGISTRTRLDGGSPRYFSEFKGGANPDGKVSNFGNHDYGRVDVRTALAKSSNTAFAELNIKVGPKATKEAAVALGVPANTPGLDDNPANVFGTASPRVLDMANAYATLAAGGKRAEPYIISRITSNDESYEGYIATPNVVDAVSPQVAADALDAMRKVVTRGTGQRAQGLGRPAAGKTGTTDENRAAWFDGVTPQLATAVALYMPDANGNPRPMQDIGGLDELTGGSYPVSIWTAYMRGALDGVPVESFPDRAGIGDDNGGDLGEDPAQQDAREDSTGDDSQGSQDEQDSTPEPSSSQGSTPTWSPTDTEPEPSGTATEGSSGRDEKRPTGRETSRQGDSSESGRDRGDSDSDSGEVESPRREREDSRQGTSREQRQGEGGRSDRGAGRGGREGDASGSVGVVGDRAA